MNIELASKIVSLRNGIESLIIRFSQQPEQILHRSPTIDQFCHLITSLSDQQFQCVFYEKMNTDQQTSTTTDSNQSFPINPQRSFYPQRNFQQPYSQNKFATFFKWNLNNRNLLFSFPPEESSFNEEINPSSMENKRQFDNAFYPSAPAPYRGNYSNPSRGYFGPGRYTRFPKRSRPSYYPN